MYDIPLMFMEVICALYVQYKRSYCIKVVYVHACTIDKVCTIFIKLIVCLLPFNDWMPSTLYHRILFVSLFPSQTAAFEPANPYLWGGDF